MQHSLFHQLSIDLDEESRRRTGAGDVRPGRPFPRGLDLPLIYDAYTEYLKSKNIEALNTLHDGLYSTLERVLLRANIVVTSCLAARNIPFFEPTVVIVDQWNTDKDWECMIPLIAFDQTEFRSIIGNFDIPHWRRMWEWNFPIALPVHFSVVLDAHQLFTSMYTLKCRISNDMMNIESREESENVSLPWKSKAVDGAAHSLASGANIRHHFLDTTFEVLHKKPTTHKVKKQIKDSQITKTEKFEKTQINIAKATNKNNGMQVAKIEKTRAIETKNSKTIEKADAMQVAETAKIRKIDSEVPKTTDQIENVQVAETKKTNEIEIEISEAIAKTEDIQVLEIEKAGEAGMENLEAAETDDIRVAETEKTTQAGIDYCTAYLGYWYNGEDSS